MTGEPIADTDDLSTALSSRLDAIATRWSLVRMSHDQGVDASEARAALVLRYSSAIRRYLGGVLRNDVDADELAQDAVVRLMRGDFAGADPNRGRFRDLLKTAIRNMAKNHWQKEARRKPQDIIWANFSSDEESADVPWDESWRRAIFDRCLASLAEFERAHPGNFAHTVLRLRIDNPEASSEELAGLLSKAVGKELRPDAVRQMLRRSRLRFAEALVTEIGLGLSDPSPENVDAELVALGLKGYVADFLPADWREHGCLVDSGA